MLKMLTIFSAIFIGVGTSYSVVAQPMLGDLPDYKALSRVDCRTFLNLWRTQGAKKQSIAAIDQRLHVQSVIADHIVEHSSIEGSACNLVSYVEAECRVAGTQATVGDAMSRLISKARSGRRLPDIPLCGA